MICIPTVFCNFIFLTITIPDSFFVLIWMQFWSPFRFMEVDYFGVVTANFINDVVFILCSYSIFRCTKVVYVFSEKADLILWDLTIGHNFSLPATYCKLILTLIPSSWISVACVCCHDRGKLWLFVILLKILLTILSWYLFSFSHLVSSQQSQLVSVTTTNTSHRYPREWDKNEYKFMVRWRY